METDIVNSLKIMFLYGEQQCESSIIFKVVQLNLRVILFY